MEMLNVLNEKGEVIRQESREVIHQNGLLHAEIQVWCMTPEGEIIFQHRAKDKDTYPDLLDATVGGHVDIGETYDESAVREVFEETGLRVTLSDLVFLMTTMEKSFDPVTGMTNYPRRNLYLLAQPVHIADLQVEEGKSLGFESWSLEKLRALSTLEQQKFIPTIFNAEGMRAFDLIEKYIDKI